MKQENQEKGMVKKIINFLATPVWLVKETMGFSAKMTRLKQMEKEADFHDKSYYGGWDTDAERYLLEYDSYVKCYGKKLAAAFAYAAIYCNTKLEKEVGEDVFARFLGNEKLERDENGRPYEYLLKRGDGEEVSNEYKIQSVLLAAYWEDSKSPYRYDIVSSRQNAE